MTTDGIITETRNVGGFNRVTLNEFGKLIITQGEAESLIIETHRDLMPRIISEVRGDELILGIKGGILEKFTNFLSSSFGGYQLTFKLKVKEIHALSVSGAASVSLKAIQTDHMAYRLSGAGSINTDGIAAESLDVRLSGTGKIELSGRAGEQKVSISGAGGYVARKLETKKASVTLSGAGKGIVWASDSLDVTISGLGSVDYYGSPTLKQNISGLGNVVGLGEPEA